MKRSASVRFDGQLDTTERARALRHYLIAGARVTSWATTERRTYVRLDLGEIAVDSPALAVLRVTPDAERALSALEGALGGAGAPAGVYEAYRDGDAIVVEFDPDRSPLDVVIATIDAELMTAPGRTIEPLLPLEDRTLVAFAASLLGDRSLDVSRLIETHLDPLLGSSRA